MGFEEWMKEYREHRLKVMIGWPPGSEDVSKAAWQAAQDEMKAKCVEVATMFCSAPLGSTGPCEQRGDLPCSACQIAQKLREMEGE